MWSGGQDANEHGEPILLFQPVGGIRQRNRSRPNANLPTSHHLGGMPCYHEKDTLFTSIVEVNGGSTNPRCKICNKQMYLLIQLNAPLDDFDRTLHVFGCNAFSCHSRGLTENEGIGYDKCNNRFHPSGSLRCFRSQQCWASLKAASSDDPMSKSSEKSEAIVGVGDTEWGVDDGTDGWGDDEDNGWGEGKCTARRDNISIGDLENLLNSCEMKSAEKVSKPLPTISTAAAPVQQPQTAASNDNTSCAVPSFECHDLETVYEPMVNRAGVDEEEDDDDDVEIGNVDKSKVDDLLSRYLDTEDDEEILVALKGGCKSHSCGDINIGGSGGGERYERLPPEERALISFTTRLKRAPGQVARYAYGGVPLWSIPIDEPQSNVPNSKQKTKAGNYSTLPVVPNCICGAERVFEFQLLPSVLHVLDVDSYATDGPRKKSDDLLDLISAGGMNWGAIAVYSCSQSCDESREEFIIVQEPVSDVPTRKNAVIDDASDTDMDDNE